MFRLLLHTNGDGDSALVGRVGSRLGLLAVCAVWGVACRLCVYVLGAQDALAPVVEAALELAKIQEFTGRDAPSVIT